MRTALPKFTLLIRSVSTVILAALVIVGVANAGSLTPSASPAATSYTLTDIYTRLTTNATSTAADHSFTPGGSPAASLYTLTQIYEAIPTIVANTILTGTTYMGVVGTAQVAAGTAVAAQVLTGYTFSNSNTVNVAGTMANNGAVVVTPSTATQTISAGYHNGSGYVLGDEDLVASNIVSGTSIFGVTGTVVVGASSTGNALAAQVLSGFTFSNSTTLGITGTMTNNGAVTITPSTTNQTIAAGYHNGSGTVVGDSDLTAANIASGTNIFGVTGTLLQSLGNALAAQVLSGYTFSNSTTANITGTMTDNGAVTITPSTTSQTIAAGYHNGSGTVAGDADLAATNIVSGTNIFGVTGTVIRSLGNALAANVLSGITFSNSTTANITGTMTDNGAVTITPSTTSQTIAAGYHNGSGTVSGDADLIPSNIVTGTNIFGVIGTATGGGATGNALAAQVLSGYTFSNSTTLGVSGSMTDNGAVTITPSTSNQTIAAGYHNGSGVVTGDSDLVASNFPSTVNLFGVTGTLFVNMFNGSTSSIAGGVTTSGGVEDMNAAGAPPSDRYTGSWTICNAGNNYCGTGLTSADAKDNHTNLIWSLPCAGARCASFSDTLTVYAWDATTTANAAGGVTSTASQLCSSGAHGQTGWYLPHQKQLMQAYINGAYGSTLEATGTTRSYWSATSVSTATSTQAFIVNIASGAVGGQVKNGTQTIAIRCVRQAP